MRSDTLAVVEAQTVGVEIKCPDLVKEKSLLFGESKKAVDVGLASPGLAREHHCGFQRDLGRMGNQTAAETLQWL